MRMTISVSDELKRRMDKVKEDVNWSALACRAFQEKLVELAKKKGAPTMKDVIERLKVSREKGANAAYKSGFEAGQKWAREKAEAPQLERLERRRDPQHDWYFTEGSSAYGACEHFYFIIEPDQDGDRGAARVFWEQVGLEEESKDETVVQGFAEGAMDVWDEVKDKI